MGRTAKLNGIFLPILGTAGFAAAAVITVNPSQAPNLPGIVSGAAAGDTVRLTPGVYALTGMINIAKPGLTLTSSTGNRGDVILDGGFTQQGQSGGVGILIRIETSDVTISHLTLRHSRWHAVQVTGGAGADTRNVTLDDLHVYDCGQQLLKVNSRGSTPNYFVDESTLSNSLIEFQDTSIMEPSGNDYYTGGLDIHGGRGWIIRDNVFRNIQRNGRNMEHAVHLWRKARDTVVERNLIIDCYRGIGFGLVTTADPALERRYPDSAGDSPYRDHVGGVIRNNVLFNGAGVFLDGGIMLNNAAGAKVYNNTVVSRDDSPTLSSVEVRWGAGNAVGNNLLSHNIWERDSPSGTVYATNLSNQKNNLGTLIQDAASHDWRLKPGATTAIDRGTPFPEITEDKDGAPRTGTPDIGADESGGSPAVPAPPARPRRLRVSKEF